MTFDWNHGGLAEGLRCYERGEFFEAHEHWEGVWLECQGQEKAFLQALIQITVAFHHLKRKNLAGAESMLRRALRRLDAYPAEFGGVEVEQVRASVRAWIEAIEGEEGKRRPPYPRFLDR